MIYQTQSVETITQRYNNARYLDSFPHVVAEREARGAADLAEYKVEQRLRAIRRYLKERAAR